MRSSRRKVDEGHASTRTGEGKGGAWRQARKSRFSGDPVRATAIAAEKSRYSGVSARAIVASAERSRDAGLSCVVLRRATCSRAEPCTVLPSSALRAWGSALPAWSNALLSSGARPASNSAILRSPLCVTQRFLLRRPLRVRKRRVLQLASGCRPPRPPRPRRPRSTGSAVSGRRPEQQNDPPEHHRHDERGAEHRADEGQPLAPVEVRRVGGGGKRFLGGLAGHLILPEAIGTRDAHALRCGPASIERRRPGRWRGSIRMHAGTIRANFGRPAVP